MKRLAKAVVRGALGLASVPASRLTAAILRARHRFGPSWNAFERDGFVPVPLHFYHPYPRAADLAASGFWERRSELAGIPLDLGRCLDLLGELGSSHGAECDWPERADDPAIYATDNDTFGFTSAALAWSMLRRFKPRRIVEVGSGRSTLVMGAALARNAAEGGPAGTITAIEPFPPSYLRGAVLGLSRLIERPVERAGLAPFEELEDGDVLFIDSSHVIRYGGDVLFLYLDVLPRLAPGVIVHVHDIHLPDPYPRAYFEGERYVWDEQYLLQAFLAHNAAFEVLLPAWLIHRDHDDAFKRAFPRYDPGKHRPGSSFWMRRKG